MAAEHTPLKHVVIRLISQWFDEPLSRDGYKCQLVKSQIVTKMRDCLTMILLSSCCFKKSICYSKATQPNESSSFWSDAPSLIIPCYGKGSRTCGNFPSKTHGIPNGWSCLLFVALDLFEASPPKNRWFSIDFWKGMKFETVSSNFAETHYDCFWCQS